MSRLISDKYREYQQTCQNRFDTLKANEEELNRIFIDIYGLQEELTPDVADKDVTVYRIGTVKYYAQIHLQIWQNKVCTRQGTCP